MSEHTAIEWCDMTFNPWIGCTKVSPGCANCYAEREDGRFKWTPDGWGKGKARNRTSEANWKKVERWNDGCREFQSANTYRPRVFVASLSDWLDPEVPIEWLADLLDLIRRCQHLDFLLLTKRPELWRERVDKVYGHIYNNWSHYNDQPRGDMLAWVSNWLNGWRPQNFWVGTSVEDQPRADERIPALLKIPAVVRFLSCEPLLGAVDLSRPLATTSNTGNRAGEYGYSCPLHWVICGGESGPNARPMHPDWARSLRDQCQAADVPFFFKQWGEWVENDQMPESTRALLHKDTLKELAPGPWNVGKKAAGRLLDGRKWNEFPVVGGAS